MAKRKSAPKASPVSTRRPEWIALAVILLFGGALRALYLAELTETPDFRAPGRDALYHDYWARAIATGDWTPPSHKADPEIRSTPYMRPPVYPYFLAGIYTASGASHLAARLVQMAFGLLNVVLAYALGRAIFDARRGLVFSALVAVYWIFIYYEGELHSPVLEVTFTLVLLLVLQRWSDRPSLGLVAAGGVTLGLFALTRPNALLLAPLALGFLFWLAWRRDRTRQAIAAAAVLMASVTAVVALATLRNYLMAEDVVLVTTNAGINLYLSHNEHAAAGSLAVPDLAELAGLSGWTCFEYPAMVRGVAAKLGQDPDTFKHSGASAWFAERARSYIRSHPGKALRAAVERALLFWGPREVSTDEVVHYDRRFSTVLSRIPGAFSLALALALAGAAAVFTELYRAGGARRDAEPSLARRFETSVLLVLFVAAYFVSVLPAPAGGRYRVPVVPVLLLFAACALVAWVEGWRRGARRQVVVSVLATAVIYGLVSRPWVDYAPDEAAWHFNRATAYETVGDDEAAASAYRRSLEIDQERPEAHTNLGSVLARLGDDDGAVEQFRAALAIDLENSVTHHNLATLFSGLARWDEARRHFRQALDIRPDYPSARAKLTRVLIAQASELDQGGDARAAAGLLRMATELEPDNATAHHQLGMILARTGNLESAIAWFTRAIELDPEAAPLEMNLGNTLAMLGRFDEAVDRFRRAVELEPLSAPAHRNLAMAYAKLGRFAEAAQSARSGADAARTQGQTAQAEDLEQLHQALRSRL